MKYGHGQALDSLIKDGLWDVYNDIHMVRGRCSGCSSTWCAVGAVGAASGWR